MLECRTPAHPASTDGTTGWWTDKRLKHTVKLYMKKGPFDNNTWVDKAVDSSNWRSSIYQVTNKFETNHLLYEAEKRQRIKEREMSQHLHMSIPASTFCTLQQDVQHKNLGIEAPQDT